MTKINKTLKIIESERKRILKELNNSNNDKVEVSVFDIIKDYLCSVATAYFVLSYLEKEMTEIGLKVERVKSKIIIHKF